MVRWAQDEWIWLTRSTNRRSTCLQQFQLGDYPLVGGAVVVVAADVFPADVAVLVDDEDRRRGVAVVQGVVDPVAIDDLGVRVEQDREPEIQMFDGPLRPDKRSLLIASTSASNARMVS